MPKLHDLLPLELPQAPAHPKERKLIRRHSRRAGREGVFWRPVERKELSRILLAAKRYELRGRLGGKKNGPLGFVALEILEFFSHLVDFRTGRLDPSLDTLMLRLKRSRDAIVRALKALRHHGFIDWLRRYVETGGEGKGPQVQQTSNAYRLFLPKPALRLLGFLGNPAPLPEDHDHAKQEREKALKAHAKTLPLDERALFELGDGPLGQALARLGRSLMERESDKQTESSF